MSETDQRHPAEGCALPAAGGAGSVDADALRLSCMEVWGGNEAVDAIVRASGLDAHAFSLPYGGDANGGDVLHLTACSSGRITRALLADVAGHGEGAAEAAKTLRQLMGHAVNILDQAKLVKALNEGFSRLQEQGRFASAIVASYFRPSGKLTICNAGHPPPLYYSAREREWSYLEADEGSSSVLPSNLPLGLFGSVNYELQELALEPGDLVMLYTDGVFEAGEARDDPFGTDRLLQLMSGLDWDSVDQIVPRVYAAIESWTGSTAPEDDISLMLLGRNEVEGSLRDDVLAPFRFARHQLTRMR